MRKLEIMRSTTMSVGAQTSASSCLKPFEWHFGSNFHKTFEILVSKFILEARKKTDPVEIDLNNAIILKDADLDLQI